MLANDSFHIAVIAGDGIGPEVMAPALDVLRKVAATTPGLGLRFTEAPAGAGHYRDCGVSLPEATVKLFGPDLEALRHTADEIASVLGTIRGVKDLKVEQLFGQPYITIDIDRSKIARHGI